MSYGIEFGQAMQRTSAWSLKHENIPRTDKRYLTPEMMCKVTACLQECMGHFDAEKIAVQCFAFSGFVQDALEEVLDVPLTYTLGFVKLGNKPIFYTSMEGLKEMLDAGRPATATLNLHAWLTLPSDEIIDVTFGTTLGVLRNEPEMIGRIATIHPDDMVGEHSYHPQLLGDDFLRRIGVLVEL